MFYTHFELGYLTSYILMRCIRLYLFLELNLNQSTLEKTKKIFDFARFLSEDSHFESFLNGQSPYGLRYVIVNFYLPHIFSVHPIEKRCQLFLLQEKQGSTFY